MIASRKKKFETDVDKNIVKKTIKSRQAISEYARERFIGEIQITLPYLKFMNKENVK